MVERMIILAKGMNKRFPKGNVPYEITTRILEECGEVASEVNHFESSGTKNQRHGEPSKEKLASEIKDAMNALMQLTLESHWGRRLLAQLLSPMVLFKI